MAEKKSRTWILAAAGLVGIQVLVLFGLLKLRHQDTDESREWSLDPKATVEEAAREKESREALGNLPLPEGTRRLTVAGAQAAAPQAEDLFEQARELQNRGQLDLAEKLLGQAQAKAPENNRIRVASALLAEARQDSALALQRWRDCIRASDPSGTTRRLALARARVVEERMRLEQVARQREESLAKNSRKLALAGVVEEKSGGEGRRVTWNVRAVTGNRPLDVAKVGVRVTFFERGLNGVLQKSEGGLARWEKGPPLVEGDGWRKLSAEARPSADSKYAGYSWQLFYDGELQDERIQPASLRGVLREIPRS